MFQKKPDEGNAYSPEWPKTLTYVTHFNPSELYVSVKFN